VQYVAKATVDGCTDTTNGAVKILKSSFTAKLATGTNDCVSLITTIPMSGTLVFKWKADKTTPIAQTSSTMTVTSIAGTIFTPGGSFGSASYFQFSLGTSGVSGAFTGGNGGTTSTNTFVTSQDLSTALVGEACSGAGVKAVNLGLGTLTLQ